MHMVGLHTELSVHLNNQDVVGTALDRMRSRCAPLHGLDKLRQSPATRGKEQDVSVTLWPVFHTVLHKCMDEF
jgi:hypothetical protein